MSAVIPTIRDLRSRLGFLFEPFVCSHCRRTSPSIIYGQRCSRVTTLAHTRARIKCNVRRSLQPLRDYSSAALESPNVINKNGSKSGRDSRTHKTFDARSERWELTVGIEVHSELSTASKLFSTASASIPSLPNTSALLFDTAFPGALPQLQREVLLPALRAALTLNCEIQDSSGWDRKHYFWWDQPQGYQVTQYYSPFAKNGRLMLYPWDDIDPKDVTDANGEVCIGIKQVQMEQDTAKTILQPPDTHLLDFNRAGIPLVEIITRPEIKSAKTAAAVVRKIQSLLQSVGANTTGLEMGGLRADVNVSVRSKGVASQSSTFEYDGVTGLGQRTEIKNLSSFKAVEDAVIAEQDRQIDILERGGRIEGETRGWTLGATTTRRLRGKEGEVDYRYMPDPDLAPIYIGANLIQHIAETMPKTQDDWIRHLTTTTSEAPHALSIKDARTLVELDEGERLEFYYDTLQILRDRISKLEGAYVDGQGRLAQAVCNWVLMELPTHLASSDARFPYYYDPNPYSPHPNTTIEPRVAPILGTHVLAELLFHHLTGSLTQQSARHLLSLCRLPSSSDLAPSSTDRSVDVSTPEAVHKLISDHELWFQPLSAEGYRALVQNVLDDNVDMAGKAQEELERTGGRKKGKMMWLVGQVMRKGEKGKVEAGVVERHVLDRLKGAAGP